MLRSALVLGAGGFIGGHLVRRLKNDGFWVRGVDLKYNEFSASVADDFVLGDLRDRNFVKQVIDCSFSEVYQLAADMGGAGYIFTGENDAKILHNSASINLNVLDVCRERSTQRIFFSSSACVYPKYGQCDPNSPDCEEAHAYPADPDSEYGWEKLFSERLYLAYNRNYNMQCRIARYHNIFGPDGTWEGGKEKAPAALCRKVASVGNGGSIEVWGDGLQSRSFLYIDECLDGTIRLLRSDFEGPVNIGSEEMIAINDLAKLIIEISGKELSIDNTTGPVGVRGRNSNNSLLREKLGWEPSQPLRKGLEKTYSWITSQLDKRHSS